MYGTYGAREARGVLDGEGIKVGVGLVLSAGAGLEVGVWLGVGAGGAVAGGFGLGLRAGFGVVPGRCPGFTQEEG